MTAAGAANAAGTLASSRPVILFLHNRYRVSGGEERVVDDLLWLVRERLGEDAELLDRDSAALGRGRAAVGLLRGGLDAGDVAAAVRRTGARVVHAHNLLPAFGWRALAAARAAGASTVLHLHNYRLVCAVGTCVDPSGADCTRCHGRDTLPGVRPNLRRPAAPAGGPARARGRGRLRRGAGAVAAPDGRARRRAGRPQRRGARPPRRPRRPGRARRARGRPS